MAQQFPLGRKVRVEVPASTANLGPGFDSIGLALGLGDVVTAEVVASGLHISVDGEGAGVVPDDETHLVWRSMRTAWERLGVASPTGLKLHCHNGVPHSRGLGSSAAAIVAGVAAALALVDPRLDDAARHTVSDIAGDLEGHPDNASASVYGGLTVSWRSGDQWMTTCPPVHPDIEPVLFVPDATLSTERARSVLPADVPLGDAAQTAGRAALLIEAMTRRPDLLLAGTADWLHQEARRASYPSTMELVDALRAQGHAAVVSGAGPSVLVLTTRTRAAAVLADDRWARTTPGIAEGGLRVFSL
ncbi:homoserine kinase [Allobranchiibius sp. GilTou38]|uniref:homoserine kinase n=1 Tax=Allobranchiibius sp. GilTou38 TaxID=2815210 RepID=UPI001AA119CD|nr:homoserine kinase [Allobranchiibius sp. GilTou38]MBO1767570.1 homoserine kinase [Allobranchiibius sp. GilTou38]